MGASERKPLTQSFDAVAFGTNGTLCVYEKAMENAVFNAANTMIPVYDPDRVAATSAAPQEGSRVYIQDLDGNGNPGTVFSTGAGNSVGNANDPNTAERTPRIIAVSNGYIVTWISVANTGTRPEKLLMTKYTTTGTIYSPGSNPSWNAYPVSDSTYGHIHEYSIIPDQVGGMMVVMIVSDQNNQNWRLVCQDIQDNAGNPCRFWNGNNEQMLEIAGIVDTEDFIYNPIIRYNPTNSSLSGVANYDIAWGRVIIESDSSRLYNQPYVRPYLFLQRVQLDALSPIFYPAGGENSGIYLAEDGNVYSPFYMVPAAQSQWGNVEAVLVREENWGSVDNSVPIVAKLRVHWFHMDGGGLDDFSPAGGFVVGPDPNDALYPSGLLTDDGPYDHLYVAYWNHANSPYQYEMDKFDAFTLDRDWQEVDIGNTTANDITAAANYAAELGQTNDSVFVSLPWTDFSGTTPTQGIDISRIGKTAHAVSTTRLNARRNQTFALYNDCYLSSTLGTDINGITQWHVLYYEDGLTQLQQQHLQKITEIGNLPPLPVNSAFRFQSVANTAAISQALNPAPQFNYSGIQSNLSSDQFEAVQGVAYESWSADGHSDIWFDGIPLTNSQATGYNYLEPKCAVYYLYGNIPYAYVTYLKTTQLPTPETQLCGVLIDAANDSIASTESVYDGDYTYNDMGNDALIFDSSSLALIAVYGKGSDHDVYALGVPVTGGATWWCCGPELMSTLGTGRNYDVSACYAPQSIYPGAYITWARDSIGTYHADLQYVATATGGTWAGARTTDGVYNYEIHHTRVAAAPDFVMNVWDQTQYLYYGTEPRLRIYGWCFDYAGNETWGRTGMTTNDGWLLDSITLADGGGGSTGDDPYIAYGPELAATIQTGPNRGCLIAFNTINDPDGDDLSSSTVTERVECRYIYRDSSRWFGQQYSMELFGGDPAPANDLTHAIFGYRQNTPKIIALPQSLQYFDGMPAALVAFQMAPYAFNSSTMENAGTDNEGETGFEFYNSNIFARLLTPYGDACVGNFNIASQRNSQDLENIHFSNELGANAFYLNYDTSDNFTGDVQSAQLDYGVLTYPAPSGAQNSIWHVLNDTPCGTLNTLGHHDDETFHFWNNSPCELDWQPVPTLSQFTVSPSTPQTANAYSNNSFVVTYTPNKYCDTDIAGITTMFSQIFGSQAQITFNGVVTAAGKVDAVATSSPPAALHVMAYPNPAGSSTMLAASADPELPASLRIYNLLGQQVFSKELIGGSTASQTTFDAKQLPNGNYFVVLRQGNDEVHTILTIQR